MCIHFIGSRGILINFVPSFAIFTVFSKHALLKNHNFWHTFSVFLILNYYNCLIHLRMFTVCRELSVCHLPTKGVHMASETSLQAVKISTFLSNGPKNIYNFLKIRIYLCMLFLNFHTDASSALQIILNTPVTILYPFIHVTSLIIISITRFYSENQIWFP